MSEIEVRDAGRGLVRIGTAERERAALDLGEHFAAGRLDEVEFDQRVALAYQARTAGDLAPLFADLPRPVTASPRPTNRRSMPVRPLLIMLFVLAAVAWVAFVRIPPFFIFPLLWFAFARPIHHRRRQWAARY